MTLVKLLRDHATELDLAPPQSRGFIPTLVAGEDRYSLGVMVSPRLIKPTAEQLLEQDAALYETLLPLLSDEAVRLIYFQVLRTELSGESFVSGAQLQRVSRERIDLFGWRLESVIGFYRILIAGGVTQLEEVGSQIITGIPPAVVGRYDQEVAKLRDVLSSQL